jgi:uncharacterized repeat protein (TIGR03803 family)
VYDQGTIFAVSTSGLENVIYTFAGGTDGSLPGAALLDVNGILYGTTFQGGQYGAYGSGTVFSVPISGTGSVLHSFGGPGPTFPDGIRPDSGLTDVKGILYGTTASGGAHNDGMVFAITKSGKETVIHSFSGAPDGMRPDAGLANVNGVLYGTTASGGKYNDGTVFAVTTSGTERVLYSFAGAPDGANPSAALTDVNGILYGTTQTGGKYNTGTVFAISKLGIERVLHSFGSP